MFRKTTLVLFSALVGICLVPVLAQATSGIKNGWLADFPDVCPDLVEAANNCTLCHGDAFALNDYAQDYKDFGEDWLVIQSRDSDQDSRTNEQEILLDCTLPGDPASVVANEGYTWGGIKALFR